MKNMTEKKNIRNEILAKRKQADPAVLKKSSHIICEKITALEAFKACRTVYAYADCKHEVETREIIEAAWAAGKQVAVPKVDGKNMVFYLLKDFEQLKPGTFQVPEPENGVPVEDEKAFMIVPGVAFDRQRHRAGYGAGYYDRYLEKHREHVTAAIAFDFQIVDFVPNEPTDVIPDLLITERTLFTD